jgi:glycosyltransferase involved in cell wall biosynthesis
VQPIHAAHSESTSPFLVSTLAEVRPARQPRETAVSQNEELQDLSLTSADNRKLRILLVCSEWTPLHGGISMVNRELCSALAELGFSVMCLVTAASPEEVADARRRGVQLVTAKQTPSGPMIYLLKQEVWDFHPDVVIGHDHVSGPIAATYVNEFFKDAALAHLVHTIPPEIEPHKPRPGAQSRIERREAMTQAIASNATVVAGIGTKITRYAQTVVDDGFGGVRVLQLNPGIHVPDDADIYREVPPNPTVLLLGRAEDIELKGLDIAAKALAGIAVPTGRPKPILFVRGAEENGCDRLRERLVRSAGLARDRVDVRPFTSNVDQIQHSLRRATLCIMPSRVEPFGLVAYEAIGLGTPVLLTDKSGAAEALRHHLGLIAAPMIVETADDVTQHVANWTSAMKRVLDDPHAAFTYTHKVRSQLADALSWEAMARTLMDHIVSSHSLEK